MAGEAKGQVGGLDMQEDARKRLALESRIWKCQGCGGRSNEEILKEVEKEAQASGESRKEDTIPEELKLAYREDLRDKPIAFPGNTNPSSATSATQPATTISSISSPVVGQSARSGRSGSLPTTQGRARSLDSAARPTSSITTQSTTMSVTIRVSPGQSNHAPTNTTSRDEPIPAWLDKAIAGLAFGLAFMILKKILL